MGVSRERRAKFFLAHPHCCFCGGGVLATTQDHFPSRALFTGRRWPSGYVFPACSACQSVSVSDEILVKLIARFTAEPGPEDNPRELEMEFAKALLAMDSKFPEVFKSFKLSANQKRQYYRENSLRVPTGATYADAPLVSIAHPRIHEAIHVFARKLFCALFYFHTGKIVPVNSSILFHWHTNAQLQLIETLERELLTFMPGSATLLSGNTDVGRQFRYNYFVQEKQDVAGFLTAFHFSFVLIGFVFPGREDVEVPPGMTLLRPLTLRA